MTEQTPEYVTNAATPVPDELVRLYGPIGAAVWGRIYIGAHPKDIANDLGVSKRTVARCIKILSDDGYIKNKQATQKLALNFQNGQYAADINLWITLSRPSGGKCLLCGYSGVALDDHHIHGRKNSDETIRICSNCHREIHAGTRSL